jgi:DNA-binding CsgD family transcriptional regulator
MWSALIEDTNLPVVVVDTAGTIEFANPTAARIMGVEPGAAAGRPMRDFFSQEVVTERLGLIRDAANSGRPIIVDGMIKGRLMRSVLRPMVSPGQPPRVLVVSRLAAAAGPAVAGENIVQARAHESGALASLTAREMEILKLIGVGLSTADIAKKLGRSVKTVEWHRVSLGDKLGVTNRVELARIAIAAGLVSVDEPVKRAEAPSEN